MSVSPYDQIAVVPSFTVFSNDVADGMELPVPQRSGVMGAGGSDLSPHLAWSGFPEATRSFVVTVFDPMAPTGSGFWHWEVIDIPASVTHLQTGAGDDAGSGIPAGAFQLRNDAGLARYVGAAPPKGHGRHVYYIGVHAIDVESLGLEPTASAAFLGFNLHSHTLARGVIAPWYEAK
ncbi:MAG: YbhB/YbcL family Raf kinase inhibitor-like protein [Ferrimicrobium sp.]